MPCSMPRYGRGWVAPWTTIRGIFPSAGIPSGANWPIWNGRSFACAIESSRFLCIQQFIALYATYLARLPPHPSAAFAADNLCTAGASLVGYAASVQIAPPPRPPHRVLPFAKRNQFYRQQLSPPLPNFDHCASRLSHWCHPRQAIRPTCFPPALPAGTMLPCLPPRDRPKPRRFMSPARQLTFRASPRHPTSSFSRPVGTISAILLGPPRSSCHCSPACVGGAAGLPRPSAGAPSSPPARPPG